MVDSQLGSTDLAGGLESQPNIFSVTGGLGRLAGEQLLLVEENPLLLLESTLDLEIEKNRNEIKKVESKVRGAKSNGVEWQWISFHSFHSRCSQKTVVKKYHHHCL